MTGVRGFVRRVLRLPGVPEARHVTERAVAPYLRADLTSMHETLLEHNHRLVHAEATVHATAAATADLERYQPAVLNAIASTNGTARLVQRSLVDVESSVLLLRQELVNADDRTAQVRHELEALRAEFRGFRSDILPHLDTLAWLMGRVETVRAEMMHELRYGRDPSASPVEVEVLNASSLEVDDVKLNLGCGHLALEGYANVDMRPLPGVDVVAPLDELPVDVGSVAEIFSSHVLEHFPEQDLARRMLPYWVSLLRPGGTFRAVVPDLPSMIGQYTRQEIDFEALRQVAYGGQEYEGDFHFTAFTTDSLGGLMSDAGLVDIEVQVEGRPNGDCLEFEISGRRPQ